MFFLVIDLIAENPEGPPIMSIAHLERVVRKEAFEKNILLPVETYEMFILKGNGAINVSEKKTPKMKLIIEKADIVFLPGDAANPCPERRMV